MTVKGLHFVSKKTPGKPIRWYVYAWRGGPRIAERVGGGKPSLKPQELRNALAAFDQRSEPDPHTLISLIRDWRSEDPERRSSPEWEALAPGTKRTWGCQLRQIEEKWGSTPLSLWNDPRMTGKVVQWRDSRRTTPRGADLGVTVLRNLLKFGRLRGRVTFNAAAEVPTIYRGGDRSEIVWTAEDIDRFCWHALRLNLPHMIDGIWLASLTGLRSEDLITVTDENVYEHAIIKKALKVSRGKRQRATMPRIPELDDLLVELKSRDRADGVRNLLINSRGKPWRGGFGQTFNRVRDEANIVHVDEDTGVERKKHLHDVRGTFATRLISAGLTDEEVADVMGWAKTKVALIRRVYVDQRATVVAIGERIAASGVNRAVNR